MLDLYDKPTATTATPRWSPMYLSRKQRRYYESRVRFNLVPGGRRSGKTEIAKRRLVKRAIRQRRYPDALYIAGAPTRDQAKDIYWNDLKALVPPDLVLPGGISESKLRIRLVTGTTIAVVGMDRPERAEGQPLSGGILDEYGNMKRDVWDAHIRPALTDRLGWMDLIGVPEGRNHYFDLYSMAKGDDNETWAVHEWTTGEVLPLYLGLNVDRDELDDRLRALDPRELGRVLAEMELTEAARNMDRLTFDQEYNAKFVSFEGLAYYDFDRANNCERGIASVYNPRKPLIICFDFNVRPGVLVIMQEDVEYQGRKPFVADRVDVVIDEIFIARNSNTKRICRAFLTKYGEHRGQVMVYGDATGGAKSTSGHDGSDWDIVFSMLNPVFGTRLAMMNEPSNPPERVRVNSLNGRIMSADGTVHLMIDPDEAPNLVKDFEGVTCGTDGAIEKDADSMLTHMSDAIGYWANVRRPLLSTGVLTESY